MMSFADLRHSSPPVHEYESVIWDLDGTLCYLRVDWFEVGRAMERILNLETDSFLNPPFPAARYEELFVLMRQQGKEPEVFRTIAEMETGSLRTKGVLIKPSIDLFRANTFKSVIVTNNISPTVDLFFEIAGVDPVRYISRDRTVRPKPFPDGALALENEWRNKRALFVGDSDFDKEVAEAIGVDFFRVEKLP